MRYSEVGAVVSSLFTSAAALEFRSFLPIFRLGISSSMLFVRHNLVTTRTIGVAYGKRVDIRYEICYKYKQLF